MDKKLLGTKQKLSELKNIHKRACNNKDKKTIRFAELMIRKLKADYKLLRYYINSEAQTKRWQKEVNQPK